MSGSKSSLHNLSSFFLSWLVFGTVLFLSCLRFYSFYSLLSFLLLPSPSDAL